MRRTIRQSLKEFKLYWQHYVVQSILAMVGVFIVLLCIQNIAIIGAIGSTAFVVFAIPKNFTCRAKNIIGGYIIGLLSGCLCAMFAKPEIINPLVFSAIVSAIAIGLSIFVMVVVDLEHPAASGIALGAAIEGFSWKLAAAVMISAILLSLIHVLFKRYLRDLA